MIESLRLRVIIASGLCLLFGAALLPVLFRLLLSVPEWLYEMLLIGNIGCGLLCMGVVAITTWVGLWPATSVLGPRSGPEDATRGEGDAREAKAAVLALPARVATAGVASGELLTASGWMALMLLGLPPALVLAISLTTASLVALAWLLLHALARRAIEPVLRQLQDVPQSGPRDVATRLSARLCFALTMVVAVGLVPVAVFSFAYLERLHGDQAQLHADGSARWLAVVTRDLSAADAQRLIESAPLTQGPPVASLPEALSRRGHSLQVPAQPPRSLQEALRRLRLEPGAGADQQERLTPLILPGGQALYLPARDAADGGDALPLCMATLLVLLLSAAGALSLSGDVERDLRATTEQVQTLASTKPSDVAQLRGGPRARYQEPHHIVEALARVADRMRLLHVESYLSIERTLDARRAKSQFLASMSHDLRGPLTSVLGFSELLAGGFEGEIPEAARRRLQHLHKTGRRLLRLLSEILDTAKVESRTIELHPRRCAPAELVMQAVAEARRGRLRDDISIVVDLPVGLPAVSVDPLRLPQALAHLINHVMDSIAPDSDVAPPTTSSSSGELRLGNVVRISAKEGRAREPLRQVTTQELDLAQRRRALIYESGIWLSSGQALAPPSATSAEPEAGTGEGTPTLEIDVEHVSPEGSLAPPPLGTVGLGLALPLARRLIALHGGIIEVNAGPRFGLRAVLPLRPLGTAA